MSTPGHTWSINITCPRCRFRGDAVERFDCCDCVTALRAQVAELEAAVVRLTHERDIYRMQAEARAVAS